jgi:hypothetical protein
MEGFVLIFLALIVIVPLIVGAVQSCPKCGKYWARMYLGEKFIERRTRHSTRTERKYNQFNYRTGNYDADVEIEVPVKITTDYYLVSHKCEYCDHYWKRHTTKSHTTYL